MPSSGNCNSNAYSGRYIAFNWSVKSQDIAGNKTVINWNLKGAGDASSNWYMAGNFKVVINGSTVYSSSKRIQLHKGTTVASGTYTIYHNNEGNGSFSASIEAGIYTTAVNCRGNGRWDLPQIPRASTPTVTGTKEFGATITINTNRASSTFTHTVKYVYNSKETTIASGVTTSTTWTIPKSLVNSIPNSTSATIKLVLLTYGESGLIGNKSINIVVNIPDTSEFKPTISSIALSEAVADLNTKFGGFVQHKSKIKGTVTAQGAYSSTIKSYSVSINSQSFSSSSFTTGILNGNGNCVVKVTDSRGRSTSLTKAYTCISYSSPKIATFTVSRCNTDGTLNDEGSNAKCTINASITSVNNKNTKTFELQYKKQSDSTYTKVALPNTNYALNTTKIIKNIDIDSEYDFKLVVTDYFGSVNRSVELSTGFTLINFGTNGKAIAFGKVSSKQNAMEIGMSVFDRFDKEIRNGLAAYVNGGLDANTTLDEIALCSKNVPDLDGTFFFVRTIFYSGKASNSNRAQIAYPYHTYHGTYLRFYYNGTWGGWHAMAHFKTLWSGSYTIPNKNSGTGAGSIITLGESVNRYKLIMFVRRDIWTAFISNYDRNVASGAQWGLTWVAESSNGAEGFNAFLARAIFTSETKLRVNSNAYTGIDTNAKPRFDKGYTGFPLTKIVGLS